MGEESARGFDSAVVAPAAPPRRFPATTEPTFGYVQGWRELTVGELVAEFCFSSLSSVQERWSGRVELTH